MNWQDENANAMLSYQALNERVGDRDALIWQSAALAMTAQAFLLTIGLGHDTSPAAAASRNPRYRRNGHVRPTDVEGQVVHGN